ncbi:uncharacterized protein LOC135703438 [Ochlerotatus camptorhynchus]|uniref:uncharacterized protein LOC135703438 n=1 Tax=Ochlerotatus camptorhynchus TaxID=644619 RepID=UPI0031DFDC4B
MDSRTMKHDKGTQTTIIRMLNREVQTDSLGTETESSWSRDIQTERSRSMDRWRERERKRSWRPTYRRDWTREKFAVPRWDRRWDQNRDRERERERRARHREAGLSPEASSVHFPKPVRASRQGRDITDSNSVTKLSQIFIPMNRQELDQYVKGTARSVNRSRDECSSRGCKQWKDTLDISNSDLWDADWSEKKDKNLIQSDEIGSTLFLQPTTRVIPPLASPLMEQVPEMPLEEDPRQNDNRELRIWESENESIPSSETVIAKRQKVEEAVELEEGEIASLDGDPMNNDVDHGRSSLIVSDSAESERKRAKKKDKTLQDSERRKKRSNKGKPKPKFHGKSIKGKLKELFGTDDDVDDSLFVRPETAKEKLSVDERESLHSRRENVRSEDKNAEHTTSARMQCLESTYEMVFPNHSTPPPSQECTLQREAISEEAPGEDQTPIMVDVVVEPNMEVFPDQVSTEEFQHDQLLMDASAAKTSSSNEILPLDDLVDLVDASPAKTFADTSQQVYQYKSPEVVVFSNKYSEYHVEDNNETETTIYMTRKKKKKNKSGCC